MPSLRAGLSDAVPANLRGAGFGAFNLVSVVFGQAIASVVVFALAGAFDDNFRTALLLVSPPVFIGGLVFLKARDHLEEDAAKIFAAILAAMEARSRRRAEGELTSPRVRAHGPAAGARGACPSPWRGRAPTCGTGRARPPPARSPARRRRARAAARWSARRIGQPPARRHPAVAAAPAARTRPVGRTR